MNRKIFKARCNKISLKLLGFKAFDNGDPYDVECLLNHYMKVKKTPRQFIEEAFAEDIWRIDYDNHLKEESRRHGNE